MLYTNVCTYVCLCVCEWVLQNVVVYVCVREREREKRECVCVCTQCMWYGHQILEDGIHVPTSYYLGTSLPSTKVYDSL